MEKTRIYAMSSPSVHGSMKFVGNWRLEEAIGKGAQAIVYRGIDRRTNTIGAVKEICMDQLDESHRKAIDSEVQLIKQLNHPFVIKLLDYFQIDNKYYIVYEYMERGSLYKVLKGGVFTADVCKRIIREVLLGLNIIHKEGIIHRDIKADNILVDKSNNIKISDFGISLNRASLGENMDEMNDFGTPYWMAPEVIEMKPPTTKSDIWSVGCLTLELLTGNPPYFNLTAMSAMYHISADECIPIDDKYHNISQDCMLFMRECFEKDPKKRKSAEQLLKHAWFKSKNNETGKKIVNCVDSTAVSRSSIKQMEKKRGSTSHLNETPLPIEEIMSTIDLTSLSSGIENDLMNLGSGSLTRSGSRKDGVIEDENMFESVILSNLQIIREGTKKDVKQSEQVILDSLTIIYKQLLKYPSTCSTIVSNNGLYPILSLVMVSTSNSSMCLMALQIIKEIMTKDETTYMPLLMMGLLSIITLYITSGFQSSSSALKNGVKLTSSLPDTKIPAQALMFICVEMLCMLCNSKGPVLDMVFTCGLINSAIQLLDSSYLYYVECGITCLTTQYNAIQTVSSEVYIDILQSLNVIKYIFSGLVFMITLNTEDSYYTASKLLDFLLPYTDQGKTDYLNAIISNHALDTVVYALRKEEKAVIKSSSPIIDIINRESSCLNEYKLRVLQLMKNLQASRNNLFDVTILNFLLPLLHSPYEQSIEKDIDLISSLITTDSSCRILDAAIRSNIIITIQTLLPNCSERIHSKAVRLLILIGQLCLIAPNWESYYMRYKNAACCERLLEMASDVTLCSDILLFLTKCAKVDTQYFEGLTQEAKRLNAIARSYITNCKNNNDNNVYALIEYLRALKGTLSILSKEKMFVERVIDYVMKKNANQNSSATLLSLLLQECPDRKWFVYTFNIKQLKGVIVPTKSNRTSMIALLPYLYCVYSIETSEIEQIQ